MIKILQVRNIDSFVESRRQKTSEKDKKIVQSILNDVRKNGDSAVKKYESYNDPGIEINAEITALTGISNDMVEGKSINWDSVKSGSNS